MNMDVAAPRLCVMVLVPFLGACWQSDTGRLDGEETEAPAGFEFIGKTAPCYLEVRSESIRSIRVNCFHIDGVLHIHSNRFAKLPRLKGESWVETVRRQPRVRVAIAGHIYRMCAMPIDTADVKAAILIHRGYWHAWDGITIFRFSTGTVEDCP